MMGRTGCVLLAVVVMGIWGVRPAGALIEVGRGNRPVADRNWRLGAVEVANLESRVGWWVGPPFGGGNYSFLYRGDTEAFNEALKVFAKVRAPALELVVDDGPNESPFLKDDREAKRDTHVDWSFVIWDAMAFHRLYSNPKSVWDAEDPSFRRPLDPPRMYVYIDREGTSGVVWEKVQVPAGIRVIDRRGSAAGVKSGSGAVVAGDVYDMVTSKPMIGAKVVVEKLIAQNKFERVAGGEADEVGHFRVEKVPAGVYRVVVLAEGYVAKVVGYKGVVADGYLGFEDVELAPESAVEGSVVDEGGKPIDGALVRASSVMGVDGRGYRLAQSAEVRSDERGQFRIGGVPRGFAQMVCFADGYSAPLGDILEIPAKDIVIRMGSTGAIKGKVIDEDGKAPAGQVAVSVEAEDKANKWGGGMYAKADGTFEFKNVPQGKYTISVDRNPGPEARNQKTITVTAGKSEVVELRVP